MNDRSVDHVGADLWHAFRAFEAEMYRRLGQAGFADVTQADSDILVWIEPGGMSLSALARRRGISKQAAQERVRGLATRGYVEIGPDPDDRRARLIRYTDKGRAMRRALDGVKLGLQAELDARLGPEAMQALRAALGVIRWHDPQP